MKSSNQLEGGNSKGQKRVPAGKPAVARAGSNGLHRANSRWASFFSLQNTDTGTTSALGADRRRAQFGGLGSWDRDTQTQTRRKPSKPAVAPPPQKTWDRRRILDVLPGAIAFAIIIIPLTCSFYAPIVPVLLAIGLQSYWALRGLGIVFFGLVGVAKFRRDRKTDWYQRYLADSAHLEDVIPWNEVRHIVVVPNYNEPIDTLRKTLEGLACQVEVADRVWVVLAMEAKERGASDKALHLQSEFEGRLGGVYYTLHPSDIPGEVPGKSSNEAWAAAWAYNYFVQELGYDIDTLTVSSCDADSVFHPSYFSSLTYHFSVNPERYLRIWQAPLFFHNNAWDVPAFIRLVMLFMSISQLAHLARNWKDNFPISTYSASFTLFHGAGNWDADVIPEDWHMYLKCYFARKGKVFVEPIFLPTTGDAPQAENSFKTAVSRYHQALRHAWGVADFSYSVQQAIDHPEIPLVQRFRVVGALLREHLLWSSSWFILVLGYTLPHLVNPHFFATDLGSFCSKFYGDVMIAASLVSPAFPILDYFLGPPPPRGKRWLQVPLAIIEWNLLPAITLILVSLPAIHAQAKLMFGKELVYKVTPKSSLAQEG